MLGIVAERWRELVRQACKENEAEIIKGYVSKDHIHLFVIALPTIRASKLVQLITGHSSRKLLTKDRNLQKQYWGQHLWARGYFVACSGNIAD